MCSHWIALAASLTGRGLRPLRVCLPVARPAHSLRQEDSWGCPVAYGASRLEVWWERERLQAPLVTSDPEVEAILLPLAEQYLSGLDQPLTARVQAAVVDVVKPAQSTLASVSARLSMSSRSLQRRLSDEGTTFRDVVDGALRRLAERRLGNPNETVEGVAFSLGYEHRRAFHRAFQRWTGTTPGAWRRRSSS